MPYYYFDWTYVVLVLPCVLLSLWASANVNSTFRKYSQQYSSAASPVRRPPSGCCPPTGCTACALSAAAEI